jgi:hypothetical protein
MTKEAYNKHKAEIEVARKKALLTLNYIHELEERTGLSLDLSYTTGTFHVQSRDYNEAKFYLHHLAKEGFTSFLCSVEKNERDYLRVQWDLTLTQKDDKIHGHIVLQCPEENVDLDRITGKKGCTWEILGGAEYTLVCPV